MADDNIDKALPNVEQQVTLPGEEEIVEAQETIEESLPGEPEVIEQEDGSVDINFEPGAVNQEGTPDHYANLADLLPEDMLDKLGSELYSNYTEYKQSRKDWEDSYSKGLDLLGFKYVNPSQPFEGASGATHPVLAEAVT